MQNKILYACIVIVAFLLNSIGIKAIGQNTINVCYNGDTIINLSSTHQAWVYRWEKKTTSSSFWTFSGTGVQLVISSVTQSIDVRCMADTNNDGLSDSLVRQLTISPYPELVPASISGNGTICYDSPSPIQSVLIPASGGGDIYSYQWQFSDNNGSSWYNINGATQNTYIDHNLISNRSYRLLTTSLAGCGRAYSNTTFVSVYGNLIAPTISTTTPAICYDSIPDMITMASVAQGGIGPFSYQWQLFDGEGFSDIVGETSTSFQPPALRHTMTYRLSATNECGTVYSSSISISVYPQLIAGVIDSEKNICFNSLASLSFTSNPSGGAGLYTYQWQTSNDGVFWTDIPNAIQNVYVTPQMVDSAFYRVIVGTLLCCVTDTTNVCKVNVFNPLVPGVIYGDSVICHSTAPNTLLMLADATGGSGEYSYQWQKSTNGVVWSNIVGATLPSYQPSNLSVTTNYRVVQTSSMGCGSVNSNVVTITVLPSITSPVIAPTTTSTICYDSVPADVRITEASIGADGVFSYQWQERAGGIWSDIPSATQSFFQPGALREDCSYRVVSTSDYGCGSRTSNEVTISVYPRINAGTLNDQLICHNTTATMDFAIFPTGGGNSFTYRWQHSVDGETWSDISMAVAPSYTTPVLLDTTQYRVVVTSTMGCSSDTTEAAHINVLPQFVAGTIGHDTTVCYNTSPGIVSMQSDAVGGMAPYTYQWQFSISGMPFSDVNGQMQTYYQVPTQTESMQYRLKFTSQNGCEPVYSAPINVNVWEEITAPTISTTTTSTICYDSVPTVVNITEASIGADGVFSYQWQERAGGIWSDIPSATQSFFQPGALREDCSYRVVSTSDYGCGSRTSNEVTISVYPRINAGTLNDQLICHNTTATMDFAIFPTGGGNSFTYRWQHSVDGETWSDISMAVAPSYTTPVLLDTTQYRVVVTSTMGCSSDTTEAAHINVLPQFVAGTIGHDTTVCYNTSPGIVSMQSDAVGGMAPYTYQWQFSISGMPFSDVNGQMQTYYQVPTQTESMQYRLKFTSQNGCEPVYSAPINVNVWEEITAPTISTTTTTAICYDSVPANVYIDTYPTGADGDFSYQWQSSEVLGEFVNIEGETGVSYQPDALRSDFRYRVLATSTYGCGTLISDTVIINVFPRINAGLIGNDSVICHNDSVAVQFNTMPNGGGGMYTYQWQFKNSEFDWQSFDCEGTTNYTTPLLDDTTYYRVVVISDLHCSQDTTNVVQISVLPRFVAGVLSSTVDSVCYGDKPAFNLSMIADANGGMSPYRYQWLVGTDTNNMSEAPNETTPTYQPDTIFATTYYQLVFTSSHNCGVMASNIHTIKMNPLPYSHMINGNDTVCYAQYETYFLPESSTDFSYLWSLEGGNGDVTALSPNNDSVEIYWRNAQTMDRIVVEVTDNVTGCKSTNYKQVQTSTQSAPDRTVVIRKPNSNILVCEQESPSMYYQWGYTIKATGEDVVIDNSNRRYVLLPHDFDSTKYDYWVVLAPNATSPCYSTSYYDPTNDSLIVVPEAPKLMVYNVDRQRLNITVSNVGDKATRIGVYNMMGCAVYETTLPSSSHGVTVELPERGVFVVQATPQGVEPMTEKVVVE